MTTIDSIDDLPVPAAVGIRNFVRSISDPRYLIDGPTGEVFVREDGDPWEHGAYKVTRERDGVTITRKMGTAWCHNETYAPSVA